MLLGGGCDALAEDEVSGTGIASPTVTYSLQHRGTDDGVLISVIREFDTLLQRHYDRDFLFSDAIDEIELDLGANKQLRLKYWGGHRCEPVREVPEI